MGTPVTIVVGSEVWIEDKEEAWIDGEVLSIDGDKVHVQTSNGKKVVSKASSTFAKDMETPPGGVEDMTKLSYLHEPGVLQNLSTRFGLNEIYTYTGNILIAINPFQRLPHLYDQHMMEQYKGADFGELSPHVFAVADAAYRAMINEGKSNSVLVSGESGAGKTETTKMLMRYLAYMGGRSDVEGRTVEQQVLESNPVLEAFGNAKTVRNNNSSRFGKFVEIQFDNKGRISGAAVRTYLLERSRVCQINSPERSYHAFYFLCSGPPEDLKRYKLGHPSEYHYLNQSSCYEVDRMDDGQEYLDTKRAMDVVGMSEEEQEAIFRVVAAILHLGNVDFAKGKEGDSSVVKDEKSRFHLETTAELLKCDAQALEHGLIKRVMVTRDETITKSLDPVAATVSRDGLAKTIYSRLFDWLVQKINVSIGQDPSSKSIIGVLDIYGFESFKINSFEQLCINFTNEKLQQHFNQHVFKMEQEEYTREEINWSNIDFVDNIDVLDLIEKKPGGIISLLDEACMFPRSTHETFAQKLYQTFKDHKRFKKPKLSRTDFTICHYAGEVTYGADYFLDKNKDYMVAEHNALLNASECSFVSGLFPALPPEEAKSSKFSSIGSRFKLQLQDLMVTLGTTEPRYIRCVKPNSKLKPSFLENTSIIQQLRCAGVLEAIRISCAGFPTRKTFYEFLHRFGILAPEYLDGSLEDKVACEKILEKMEMKRYQIGKTKVFLRAGQMAELDARRAEILGKAAKKIQRKMRSHIARNEFLLLRKASINIQSFCRGRLACNLYENMRRNDAAIKIQKNQRRHITLVSYNTFRSHAIVLEAGLRGMVARKEFRFRKETKAATALQAKWRCHRDYSYYKGLQNVILTYQCSWRQKIARKELKKLKIASRETGALKDAKDKLEKRVEELTLRLGLEKRGREDWEKSKEQEITKLQEDLHEMHLQVEEANSMVAKEKEAAKKAIEEAAPVIQETPVFVQDTEKIESLIVEIENLKELLQQGKSSIDASQQEIANLRKENEKLVQELENARKQIDRHQDSINRFEEKLLNSESENQVLRQQAISLAATNKDLSQQLTSALAQQRLPEKSNIDNSEENANMGLSHVSTSADQEKEEKPHKLLNEKKLQENQEFLVEIITHDIGFSNGRPVSACVVFKSLLHWGSFEMEKTSVFENIIQKISTEIEGADNIVLSYWLSNSSMLLLLLQRTLKAGHSTSKRRSASSILWGKLSQGSKSASSNVGLKSSGRAYIGVNETPQVEAKYPALLFKQQLTAFIEKIYGVIRDDLKKEISSYLGKCIQAPRTSRVVNTAKGSRSEAKSTAQQALLAHWHTIVEILGNYLKIMKEKYVQPFLICKIFAQVFSFINVQLFNSLLLRRECCSFSNGEYLKTGLGEFELWCKDTTEVYAGASWLELKHIRQAVSFLVTHQKAKKSLKEITDDLCPDLSVQQLYRISTMYYDDIYGTHTVSNDVISKMKVLMTEVSNNSDTGSFLLDDDSSIPFSVDDISRSKSLAPIDITDIEPPSIIRQNSGFHFLMPRGLND